MLKFKKQLTIIILLLIFFISLPASANTNSSNIEIANHAPNPSAFYCKKLGYEFIIKDTPEGQIGICKFSDSQQASAWDFLRGKEATEKSYCNQKGYKMKIIDDPQKCGVSYSPDHGCMVCVLQNGNEVEVSDLLQIEKTLKSTDIKSPDLNFEQKNTTKPILTIIFIIITIIIILFFLIFLILLKKRRNNDIYTNNNF